MLVGWLLAGWLVWKVRARSDMAASHRDGDGPYAGTDTG